MNTDDLTEDQQDQLFQCAVYVDEVSEDLRKGSFESRYIIQIPEDSEWHPPYPNLGTKKVDSCLVGYWMQKSSDDNSYYGWERRLAEQVFVKCEPVVVKTIDWREIDE